MIYENTPENVKAACFLTDSIAIDRDLLSNLEIDMDISNYKTLETGLFFRDGISEKTGEEFILVPKEEISELIMVLYEKDRPEITQEILDLVDSDFFEMSSKIGNKSFRVSTDLYIKLICKCFKEDLTLANVVREKFKNEILEFIKDLEEQVELESKKKEYIIEELDEWVKSGSSRDSYHLPISIPSNLNEYKEMIQGEYILAKHYFDKKIKEGLDEEAYKVFNKEILPKINFKFSGGRLSILEQVEDLDSNHLIRYNDGKIYVTYNRLIMLLGDWSSYENFKQFVEGLEHGEEILKALYENGNLQDIYPHYERHCPKKKCNHDQTIEIDTTILSEAIIKSEVTYNGDDNLLIAGIPLESEDFIDRFIEVKKKVAKNDIFGTSQIEKYELQKKAEIAIRNGDFSKARCINEKILLLDILEDYFYFIAVLFSKIEKQVITVSGLKDILQLVDAVREYKNLEDVLWEG